MCKSLKAIRDTTSVREQTQILKQELKEGIDSSKQQLKNKKRNSVLMKREESMKWEKEIQAKRNEESHKNREKKQMIKDEERMRKADKLKAMKLEKVKKEKNSDSSNLNFRTLEEEKQLMKLELAEQELLRAKE